MGVKVHMTDKQGFLRDHRCKGTNMTCKCKIFMTITEHFMKITILYICTCVYNFKGYWHK